MSEDPCKVFITYYELLELMVMRAYLGLGVLLGAGGVAARGFASSVPKAMNSAEVHSRILNNNAVLVFSKTSCPYCHMAKDALAAHGITPDVIELDVIPEGPAIQSELAKLTGQRTVPNVFIKSQHLGGCDDTLAAIRNQSIDKMLKE